MRRMEPLKVSKVPELQSSIASIREAMGFVPSSLLIMARRPEYVTALSTLVGVIGGPGEIDQGLKFLVAEVASKAAGCQYCVAHSAHAAHQAGVSQEKMDAVWSFETSDLFSSAEKSALTIAMGAAQVPNLVTDEEFATLREHFDESQIVEIIIVIALFGFLNRWNDTMATPLEEEPKEFAEKHLSPNAWSVGKHNV